MAKLPWVKFNPSEWLSGDIQLVSLEAQALYLNICSLYWKTRGKVTMLNVSKRYANALAIVSELHSMCILEHVGEGMPLTIPWLDREMSEAIESQEKKSSAGRAGAAARWGDKGNADALPPHSEGNGNKTETKTQTKGEGEGEEKKTPAPAPTPVFSTFKKDWGKILLRCWIDGDKPGWQALWDSCQEINPKLFWMAVKRAAEEKKPSKPYLREVSTCAQEIHKELNNEGNDEQLAS